MRLMYEINNNDRFIKYDTEGQIETKIFSFYESSLSQITLDRGPIGYKAHIMRRGPNILDTDVLKLANIINSDYIKGEVPLNNRLEIIRNISTILWECDIIDNNNYEFEIVEAFFPGCGALYAIVHPYNTTNNILLFKGRRGEWVAGEYENYSGSRFLGYNPPRPMNNNIKLWTSNQSIDMDIFGIKPEVYPIYQEEN